MDKFNSLWLCVQEMEVRVKDETCVRQYSILDTAHFTKENT